MQELEPPTCSLSILTLAIEVESSVVRACSKLIIPSPYKTLIINPNEMVMNRYCYFNNGINIIERIQINVFGVSIRYSVVLYLFSGDLS